MSISLLKGPIERHSPAFSGDVATVAVDNLDTFYRENREAFETSGVRSFVQAMGIPPTFFLAQAQPLQQDILISQKSHLRREKIERVAVVTGDAGKVVFAAPDTGLKFEDPMTYLGLTPEKGWYPARTDAGRGLSRYVFGWMGKDQVTYQPSIFVNVPFFYSKALTFEVGMFKYVCKNGAIDRVSCGAFRLAPKEFSTEVFAVVTASIAKAMEQISQSYGAVLGSMKGRGMKSKEAMELLNQVLVEKIMPKSLVDKCFRHVDRISEGEENDEGAPQKLETEYDLFDTMTFYAQRMPSITSQASSERGVFSLFASRSRDRGVSLSPGFKMERDLLIPKSEATPETLLN